MEKELTYLDFESLFEGIKQCGNQSKQPFRTKMLRNGVDIKKELLEVYKGLEEPKGWEEYREKETKIIDVLSTGRDSKGNPTFGENTEEAERQMLKLRNENMALVEQFRKMNQDFRKNVLEKPAGIKLRYLAETELPKDLTLSQLMGISKLITFTDETKPTTKKKV